MPTARLGLAVALAVVLAALLGPLPVAARAASPSFVHNGKVTMCSDPTYPPMEMYAKPGDRSPVGFDIDLARRLAEMWGAKLSIQAMDFTGLLPGLGSHRCDFVISGMFITKARTEVFDAVPYLRSAMVLLVRADNTTVHGPDDLAGKVLVVQAGTVYEIRAHALAAEFVKEGKPSMMVQAYPKGTDVAEQLLTGRADGGFTQDTEAAFRAVSDPGKFKVAYVYPPTDTFGLYFNKNASDVTLITAEIGALRKDGLIKTLAAKWHLPEADATAPLP
ncbi:MAG TPA: transporter substrate-binding domain-containing protein [Acetobacteraceae bacterium]|nr:transporter substrate-binding domain-containing protein [Acetobacteraceae bacterium]